MLLTLMSMQCNFLLKAKQVPGKSNGIGESLSRQQIGHFRQLAPDADLHLTLILPSGDIGELTQMVKYCQSLPLNEKTQRIYDQLARAYQSFCSICQSLSIKGKVRLKGETRLMCFVIYYAQGLNLAFFTIDTYLYGIRNWHIGMVSLTHLRIR